jgi:hypothetical protein
MKTCDEKLFIGRAIILTGALLAASGFVALAQSGPHALRSAPGLQDTSPPSVSLDPDRLDFGDAVAGRWSQAKRVSVTNTGGQPLIVDSVAVGGDDSGNFSVVKDTCTGAKVSPYRACIIDISFGPSRTGDFEAELKLIDNGIASPRTMRLEGVGINSIDAPPFDER